MRLVKITGFWTLLLKIVRCLSFIIYMSNSSYPNCNKEEKFNSKQKYIGIQFCFGGHLNTLIYYNFKIEICTQLHKSSSYNNSA